MKKGNARDKYKYLIIITLRQNQGINEEKENQKREKLSRKQAKEENRKLRVEDREKSAIGAAKMPRRTVGEAEEDGDKDGEAKERERERERERVQSK